VRKKAEKVKHVMLNAKSSPASQKILKFFNNLAQNGPDMLVSLKLDCVVQKWDKKKSSEC